MAKNVGAASFAEDVPPGASTFEASSPEGRLVVPKAYRPIYNEVARLSALLGLARKACYAGAPDRAVRALTLLHGAIPTVIEIALLTTPEPEMPAE